jgi:hypothetical protein
VLEVKGDVTTSATSVGTGPAYNWASGGVYGTATKGNSAADLTYGAVSESEISGPYGSSGGNRRLLRLRRTAGMGLTADGWIRC